MWAGAIGAEGEGRAGGQVQEATGCCPHLGPAPSAASQLPAGPQGLSSFPWQPRPAGQSRDWRVAVPQTPVVQVWPQPGLKDCSAWPGRTEASPAR